MTIKKEVLRIARPIPLVGQVTSLARSRDTLNEKGALLGGIDIALDMLPVIGRFKGLFEIFAGDLVTTANLKRGIQTMQVALQEIEQKLPQQQLESQPTQIEAQPQPAATATPEHSQEMEEELNFYPEESARIAALRARAALRVQRPAAAI